MSASKLIGSPSNNICILSIFKKKDKFFTHKALQGTKMLSSKISIKLFDEKFEDKEEFSSGMMTFIIL